MSQRLKFDDSARPSELWYTRCPVPTATSIAIAKGWLNEAFADLGIEVRSLRSSASRDVRQSHFDHSQRNSFRQGGNAPPIWSRSAGADTVVIGLTWLPQYQSILSLGSSGIRLLVDLRGKRLAIPKRTGEKIDFWRASALQGYEQSLATVGLSLADVELVELPVNEPFIHDKGVSQDGPLFGARESARAGAAEAFALIRGDVDAIYQYGAGGPALEAFLDAHVVFDIRRHSTRSVAINNGTPNVLTVSGSLAREHPTLVATYLAQVLRAAYWARTHREEAFEIIANEVSSTVEWTRQAFDASVIDNLLPSLDTELIDALKVRKHFLLEHGFLERDFNVDDWIDREPLRRAKKLLESDRATRLLAEAALTY